MASDYQLVGTIKLISDAQSFNSGFTKREFVVTDEDAKYPQDIKFECIKEKCELLDGYSNGEKVNVSFNIRGNEYNGRYYVNLQAWRIEKAGGGQDQGGGGSPGGAGFAEEPPAGHGEEASDDIPF